jgi:hypothetical protein
MNGLSYRIKVGLFVLSSFLLLYFTGSFWNSVQRQRAYDRLRKNNVLVFYECERWATLLEITSASSTNADLLKAPAEIIVKGRQNGDAKFAFFHSDAIEPSVWKDLLYFPELRGFCMSGRSINEYDLSQIPLFSQLEELSLLGVESSIDTEAINKLRQMPRMKQLVLPREIAVKYDLPNRSDLGPVWNGYDELFFMWDENGESDEGRRGLIFANEKRSFTER